MITMIKLPFWKERRNKSLIAVNLKPITDAANTDTVDSVYSVYSPVKEPGEKKRPSRTVTGGRNSFFAALANPMWTPTTDVLTKRPKEQTSQTRPQKRIEEAPGRMALTPDPLPSEEKTQILENKDRDVETPVQKTVTVTKAVKKTKALRVAAYCRVSTDLQSQENSFDNQRQYYFDLISTTPGWTLVDIFAEQGVSGTGKVERKELDRLLNLCRAGSIDLVLCKSISRLARNTTECLSIIRELANLNVSIRFEKENIDTDTMTSEFIITILAAFAQEESKSISGNMKWRIQKQFEEGSYRITQPAYGYIRNGFEYEIDKDAATVVRYIYASVLSGNGAGIIAGSLNTMGIPSPRGKHWSNKTVLDIIKNPFYCGDVLLQKTYVDEQFKQRRNDGERDQYLMEDHHERIVSREDFELANRMVEVHKKPRRSSNPSFTTADAGGEESKERAGRHVLSGLLICPTCHTKMALSSRGRYRCTNRAIHLCDSKDIYEEDIKNAFITVLNKLVFLDRKKIPEMGSFFGKLQESQLMEEENRLHRELLIVSGKLAVNPLDESLRLRERELEMELEKAVRRRNMTRQNEIDDLQRFIRHREISGSFDQDAEESMVRFIDYITVDRFIEFHFKCGLVLKEAARHNHINTRRGKA